MRRLLPFLFLLAMAGCQQHPTQGTCDDSAIVDTDVMAFLSKARAAHHRANVLEADGKLADAITSLDELVKSPIPRPGTNVPEIEEVLADTYARMADLRLQLGDMDAASNDINAGLAHAPQPSYFRGHLLEVQGIIEEQRASKLADAGKPDEAAAARKRATTLLKQAIDMQDQVIKGLTSKEGGK